MLGKKRQIKKTWVMLILLSIFIGLSFMLLNYQTRVSLLINLAPSNCKTISSDGKWLACNVASTVSGDWTIDFYSTNFPFYKKRIHLPPISLENGEGLFDNFRGDPVDLSSWSSNGSDLLIKVLYSEKADSIDFCIIHLQTIASNEVNCYKDDQDRHTGSLLWSIDGKGILYSFPQPDGSYEITLLSNTAKVAQKFSLPIGNELLSEPYNVYYFWHNKAIFLSIESRQKFQIDNSSSDAIKTKIIRIPMDSPQNFSTVFESTELLSMVSVDPDGRFLLLVDNSTPTQIELNVIDSLNGTLVKNLIQEVKAEQFLSTRHSYCLLNCTKTAIEENINNDQQVLTWSWKNLNYSIYPDSQFVIGRIYDHDGFLCKVNNPFLGKIITTVKVCQ